MLDNHLDAVKIARWRSCSNWQPPPHERLADGRRHADMLRGAPIRDSISRWSGCGQNRKIAGSGVGGTLVSEDPLKRWVELELPGGITASVGNARNREVREARWQAQITPATIHADLARRDFTI